MNGNLNQILLELQNPDISSSALPLLVVTIIFFCGSLFAAYKVLSQLRIEMREKRRIAPKTEKKKRFTFGGSRWRAYFPVPTHKPVEAPVTARSSELDQLRELVRKLEQANQIERELHAKAIRKITELQGELQSLFLEQEEERKLLGFERARRARLDDKVAQLETQLQGAIHETERIFEKSSGPARPKGALLDLSEDEKMIALPDPQVMKKQKESKKASPKSILSTFPPPQAQADANPAETIAKQAEEIAKLKGMLREMRSHFKKAG